MAIIPPRRDESLIEKNGSATQRIIKFFEAITRQVNSTESEVVTGIDVDLDSGARFASAAALEDLQNQVSELKNFIRSQVAGLMCSKGPWAQDVIYEAGNFAVDAGWSGVALRTTQDRLSPQEAGAAEFMLPDVPAWITNNVNQVVTAGATFVFTDNVQITTIRVWVPAVSVTTVFNLIIANITDPSVPVVTRKNNLTLLAGQWNNVSLGRGIFQAGETVVVALEQYDESGTTLVTGGWTRGADSNNANPPAENWNRSNNNTTLRIDKTDLNTIDRSSELLGVTPGSIIELVETAIPANNRSYTVNSVADGGSCVTYGVTLDTSNGSEPGVGVTTTINISIPIPSGTQLVELPGFFPAGSPDWATVTGYLDFDGVVQPGEDVNAFGVDVEGVKLITSPDWQLYAYSAEFSGDL